MKAAYLLLIARLAVIVLACHALYTANAATTNYVATTGADNNDPGRGQSWALPYLTISNGVAKATNVNDTVLVSNGEYLLTAQITISSQITVKSWHDGAEDPTNTIVNGQGNVRCFRINHNGAVVQGFTIYNGNGSAEGGGVYLTGGTLRNCIVVSNSVPTNNGGGVYVPQTTWPYETSTGLLDNCVLAYNTATNGGGIYFWPYNGAAMVVTNCVIRNNQAFTGGHGVWMQGTGGSTAILANCSVYWNLGRGIYMVNASIVKNCVISNNFSGGIATGPTGMPLITNCVVITNICNGDGGGIYLLYGIIANCQIIANQMTNTAGNTYGGGVSIHNSYTAVILNSEIRNNFSAYMGGGIKLPGVTATMRNCLIAGNVAQSGGGGVYIYGAGNTLENCTIVSNRTLDTRGGGIYNACTNWMANSILYFNVVASGSGSNFYNSSGYPGSAGYCIYSNCCLSPALTGETTNYSVNNVTNDPQLVSRESGNFRLLPASPCINSGVNRDWMNGAVDLDSHSRLDHYSRIVDMGCFEYLPGGSMYSGF